MNKQKFARLFYEAVEKAALDAEKFLERKIPRLVEGFNTTSQRGPSGMVHLSQSVLYKFNKKTCHAEVFRSIPSSGVGGMLRSQDSTQTGEVSPE